MLVTMQLIGMYTHVAIFIILGLLHVYFAFNRPCPVDCGDALAKSGTSRYKNNGT